MDVQDPREKHLRAIPSGGKHDRPPHHNGPVSPLLRCADWQQGEGHCAPHKQREHPTSILVREVLSQRRRVFFAS